MKTVTVTRSASQAFDLWATSEGLAAWWTDKNHVELRPGGAYELHFLADNPPGNKGADWCRVLSFLPGKMLSFTWNAPPHLETRPLMTWVVLTFDPVNGDKTRVTLTHTGWPASGLADESSDWPATFAYFDEAWASVMERFAAGGAS